MLCDSDTCTLATVYRQKACDGHCGMERGGFPSPDLRHVIVVSLVLSQAPAATLPSPPMPLSLLVPTCGFFRFGSDSSYGGCVDVKRIRVWGGSAGGYALSSVRCFFFYKAYICRLSRSQPSVC